MSYIIIPDCLWTKISYKLTILQASRQLNPTASSIPPIGGTPPHPRPQNAPAVGWIYQPSRANASSSSSSNTPHSLGNNNNALGNINNSILNSDASCFVSSSNNGGLGTTSCTLSTTPSSTAPISTTCTASSTSASLPVVPARSNINNS